MKTQQCLTQDSLEALAFKHGGDITYTADTAHYELDGVQYYAALEQVSR